jgi:putative flippase GtrA
MSERRFSGMQPAQAERMIRFLLVGVLTFVIYYAVLYFLHTGSGMRYPLAIAISYSLAVAFHFLINRSFTFRVPPGGVPQQLRRYGLAAGVNYFAQVLIVRVLFERIGFGFYWSATIAIATTTLTGFVLLDKWVFTRTERGDCAP